MLSQMIIFELIAFGNNLPKFNTKIRFAYNLVDRLYLNMPILNESLTFEVDSKESTHLKYIRQKVRNIYKLIFKCVQTNYGQFN